VGKVQIYSGICGFTTEVKTESADRQHVAIHITSNCPDVIKISKKFRDQVFDAYQEIGPCAQARSIYDTGIMRICGALPHVACPVPSGICKAVEVAAGLAIPRDAHIKVFGDDETKHEGTGSEKGA